VHELKSQVRDLKRLLERRNDRLPADTRIEKERALKTAQQELANAQKANARSEVIARWHKIRFFDRKKASRRLAKARKELAGLSEDDPTRSMFERRVQEAEIDVNYAQYYPLEQDYVPRFPRKNEEADDKVGDGKEADDNDYGEDQEGRADDQTEPSSRGDEAMRAKVAQCMVNGTLDSLRKTKPPEPDPHGASGQADATSNGSHHDLKRGGQPSPDALQGEHGDSGAESDGFFE